MNCEAYSSFEGVSADHRIVSAKIHQSLHRNKKQTSEASQYDWSSLANQDISNQYTVIVRSKFDTLQEISQRHTPNDKSRNSHQEHTNWTKCGVPSKSIVVRKRWDNKKKTSFIKKNNKSQHTKTSNKKYH